MNKFNKKPHGSRLSGARPSGMHPPGGRPHFGGGPRPRTGAGPRDSRSFGDRKEVSQKFDAICSQCGKKCQVPFRPNGVRPVYCNECFGAPHDAPQDKKTFSPTEGRSTVELTRQIAAMNNKIDTMLKILQGDSEE